MGKYKKSQILILTLIVVLLSVTPFLSSSSIKATHLYFIINILIVAVGAEAGLLSAISAKDGGVVVSTATGTTNKIATPLNQERVASIVGVVKPSNLGKISTNAAVVAREVKMLCTRGPSIFFISVGETKGNELFKEEEEAGEAGTDGDALAGQELSTKADTFISNFYKEMKMQREENQENFHGLLSKC